MNIEELRVASQEYDLDIMATLHPDAEKSLPVGTGTLVMLGPDEPRFWPRFQTSAEYLDKKPDPLDRWSKRAIGALAERFDATAIFPSDGPPYPPFINWALTSGQIWQSPVGLLVHTRAGLFVSFRGAIALSARLPLPAASANPCNTCVSRPCRTACPVKALGEGGYDLPACHAYLDTKSGSDCMTGGCVVRRACPISQGYGRLNAQSAFHMQAFHPI